MTEQKKRMTIPPPSPVLNVFKGMIDGLRDAIGPDCEIVLHDFRNPQSTIIAIAGSITDRSIGGPPTDLLLRLLRERKTDNHVLNYETNTPDGRTLRSSTLFVRDGQGETIGSLCINIDITYVSHFKNWITAFCQVHDALSPGEPPAERFPRDVRDVLNSAIEDAVVSIGIPVAAMQKAERMRVVELLDEAGIFTIKSSLVHVAQRLNVSRATVYSYLEEIGAARSQKLSR